MRRAVVLSLLLVLATGCATSKQLAIRFGVVTKVTAETARDTVKVLHDHKLIEEEVYDQAKVIYKGLEKLSKEYRDALVRWPAAWPWTPREVLLFQKELSELLAEWEEFVAAMPVRAPPEEGD